MQAGWESAGEISVSPNCKITFQFKVWATGDPAEAPAEDKESLKAGLPAGNSAWAKHMEQQLYGSCRIEFNLKGEVSARAHPLRALAFKV